jgi:galactokinase
MTERIERLVQAYGRNFDTGSGTRIFRAPGRVNLIGEHTDYNDGFVFPVAIDRDITIVASPRKDTRVTLHALDYETTVSFDLNDINHTDGESWGRYPKGVAAVLQEEGLTISGLDGVLDGTVPLGAGLSSSAALEGAVATMFCAFSNDELTGPRMAQLCQRAENEYAGVQCGIMDQFISCVAQPASALFLDCRSLEYTHVPFVTSDYTLLIVNTNVPRGLVDSEYNRRRQECEEGVRLLSAHLDGITALRDVRMDQFGEHRGILSEIVANRCVHVISENDRVQNSVDALKNGDFNNFGRLMNDSHDSLRDLYQVSCEELDTLVNIARSCEGVLGSRMTGGGFGGCTVSLVANEYVDSVEHAIRDEYPAQTGYQPDIYICQPAGGAGEVE